MLLLDYEFIGAWLSSIFFSLKVCVYSTRKQYNIKLQQIGILYEHLDKLQNPDTPILKNEVRNACSFSGKLHVYARRKEERAQQKILDEMTIIERCLFFT